MNHKKTVLFLFFVYLTSEVAVAQDSDRVVIVSPRVGELIDQQEQKYFYMFQTFGTNFLSAAFYVTPEDSFYASVHIQTSSGDRDTIIRYTRSSILRLSEKIDHMEEIIAGTYTMGTTIATIATVSGKKSITDTVRYSSDISSHKKIMRNLLPFDTQPRFEEGFPKFSFGFGISTYDPDFTDLKDAFIIVANRYQNRIIAGQNFIPKKPDLNFKSLLCFSLSWRISHEYAVDLQSVQKSNDVENFGGISLSLLYYPQSLDAYILSPFFGLGVGRYIFSTSVNYEIAIDNATQYSVTYLEKITSSGANYGLLMSGGFDLKVSAHYAFQFAVEYLVVPEIQTTLVESNTVKVNLGSIVAAGRFQVVF